MTKPTRYSANTVVDRNLFDLEKTANDAISDHGAAVSAAYLGAIASRVPKSNFQEELAPFFIPYTLPEIFRHPIQARRWAKAIPVLGGESIKAIVNKPNQLIRPTVLLAEHTSGILLPDGKYILPNGQITEVAVNIYYDANDTTRYIDPFDKRCLGEVMDPGDGTRAEAVAWSLIRGGKEFAPAVEITGETSGVDTETTCEYINNLASLIDADKCYPPLPPVPRILKDYIELG